MPTDRADRSGEDRSQSGKDGSPDALRLNRRGLLHHSVNLGLCRGIRGDLGQILVFDQQRRGILRSLRDVLSNKGFICHRPSPITVESIACAHAESGAGFRLFFGKTEAEPGRDQYGEPHTHDPLPRHQP